MHLTREPTAGFGQLGFGYHSYSLIHRIIELLTNIMMPVFISKEDNGSLIIVTTIFTMVNFTIARMATHTVVLVGRAEWQA